MEPEEGFRRAIAAIGEADQLSQETRELVQAKSEGRFLRVGNPTLIEIVNAGLERLRQLVKETYQASYRVSAASSIAAQYLSNELSVIVTNLGVFADYVDRILDEIHKNAAYKNYKSISNPE